MHPALDPDTPYFRITSSAINTWVSNSCAFGRTKLPTLKNVFQNENKHMIETHTKKVIVIKKAA